MSNESRKQGWEMTRAELVQENQALHAQLVQLSTDICDLLELARKDAEDHLNGWNYGGTD